MTKKYDNILKYIYEERYIKVPFIIDAAMKSSLKKNLQLL